MICRFCGQDKKLIKAHIIPEGMFTRLREGQRSPRLLSSNPEVHPKKVPIGIYDKMILCALCEKQFDPWDDYAQKILVPDASVVAPVPGHHAFLVDHFDYSKLKLFFISVLWRASVSSRDYFSGIRLGPHECHAKKMIQNANPGSPSDFGVVIARFGGSKIERTMFDPYMERIDEVNYARVYMAGFIASIKVDSRPTPQIMEQFQMAPNDPLVIIERDFSESPELELIKGLRRSPRRIV